jgi:cytochrome b
VAVIKLWDFPTRLFHWCLVLAIIGLFVTGKLGGNWMEWHQRLGFFVLGLILFRLVWGVVGSHTARFSQFVRGPRAVIGYLRGLMSGQPQPVAAPGHNPLGALSVVAMLVVVGFQAVSGLFSDDDILLRGPYAAAVSKDLSEWFSKMHEWNSNLIIGLVVLHLAAIAFYVFYKKDNLVKPMITGEKSLPDGQFQTLLPENARPAWVFVVVVLVVAATTYCVVARPFW